MDIEGAIAVPTSLQNFRAALDSKEYDPQKPFKRYYHIGRWAKGRDINWRTCFNASNNSYGNATPECLTCLQIDTVGYGVGDAIGAVRVTYYAKFKARDKD